MNQKELIDIWNCVWVEGMAEIEIQKNILKNYRIYQVNKKNFTFQLPLVI